MNQKDTEHKYLPIGMCLGIGVGTAIGAVTDNMGFWMSIGVSIGVGLGAVIDMRLQGTKED